MTALKALSPIVLCALLACDGSSGITEFDTGSPYDETLISIPASLHEFKLWLHYQGNHEAIAKRLRFDSTAVWRIISFRGAEGGEQWVQADYGYLLYEQDEGTGTGPCFRVCEGIEYPFRFWSNTDYYESLFVIFKQLASCPGSVVKLRCS
jgi:hypothetical protein